MAWWNGPVLIVVCMLPVFGLGRCSEAGTHPWARSRRSSPITALTNTCTGACTFPRAAVSNARGSPPAQRSSPIASPVHAQELQCRASARRFILGTLVLRSKIHSRNRAIPRFPTSSRARRNSSRRQLSIHPTTHAAETGAGRDHAALAASRESIPESRPWLLR